jgi:2Fe-2S ferredoxin
MRAARENNVPGILGECGGACCCATCHVYVDDPWVPLLPKPDELEEELLGFTAAARKPTSRLCCQITASDDLDGLVVFVAPSQH